VNGINFDPPNIKVLKIPPLIQFLQGLRKRWICFFSISLIILNTFGCCIGSEFHSPNVAILVFLALRYTEQTDLDAARLRIGVGLVHINEYYGGGYVECVAVGR
jgi:hypothetical protein